MQTTQQSHSSETTIHILYGIQNAYIYICIFKTRYTQEYNNNHKKLHEFFT